MKEMRKTVLVTVSGKDHPGITAAITGVIASANARLLDVEQATTRGALSLSFLVEIPEKDWEGKDFVKDLLFQAREQGVEVDFCEMDPYLNGSPKIRYALTLLGEEIGAIPLSGIASVLAARSVNIDEIRRLSSGRLSALEMLLSASSLLEIQSLKKDLLMAGNRFGMDIALQPENLYRRAKRLILMDMDSTLVKGEVIDSLARKKGVGRDVEAITLRAMKGEIPFVRSLKERVALLKGLPVKALEEVWEETDLAEGAVELVAALQHLGYRTGVISGGFTFFASRLKRALGLDYAVANRLEIKNRRLTGRLIGPIIDGEKKAETLVKIAGKEGIALEQVVAVGDGVNDLPMLLKAGLGIAFNAKPKVKEQANHALNQQRLDSILFLLGLSEDDLTTIKSTKEKESSPERKRESRHG